MKNLIKRIKAYLRLVVKNDRRKRVNSFSRQLLRALYQKEFSDTERAKILEIVSMNFHDNLQKKKDNMMNEYLDTERALATMHLLQNQADLQRELK